MTMTAAPATTQQLIAGTRDDGAQPARDVGAAWVARLG
jgi:hypothetical protein